MALDIDMCARHAQQPLVELWDSIRVEHGIGPLSRDAGPPASTGRTATIYHFGRSSTGDYVWYVFRSTAGFAPERWDEGGFGIKPAPDGGFGPDAVSPDTVEEMVELGLRIRAEQDERPRHERVSIGGQLWLTSIRPDGLVQTCVHEFDDRGDIWNEMNELRQAT